MPSIDTTPSDVTRATISQPMFDRFRNEWQQMRANAPEPRRMTIASTGDKD